jgi:hypothetical protein
MTMSNYPEGVSGSEYAIAGPQDEYTVTEEVTCDECGWEGDYQIDVSYYDGEEFGDWVCGVCDRQNYYSHYPQFDWSDS